MQADTNVNHGTVIYIPHGGGPLPLLGDSGHHDLVEFLKSISGKLNTPSAIILISAHWEESVVHITSGESPDLIYDYSGFPKAAYELQYPAPGNPLLANKIFKLLQTNGIEAKLNSSRGFDHGLYVPLMLMFPQADIPCVQISLLNTLDASSHINIGNALSSLLNENILIIGSGFSFHNMSAFFTSDKNEVDTKNDCFQRWLIDTCTNVDISKVERTSRLNRWSEAPAARYVHPREEHLLPLHVCYGLTNKPAKLVYEGKVIGKKSCAFMW